MGDHEESREDWEKEFVDVQRHYTFADGLRSSQIVAKKLSATPAPIPDVAHLVRLLLSVVLLAVAFSSFRPTSHTKRCSASRCSLLAASLGFRHFDGFTSAERSVISLRLTADG